MNAGGGHVALRRLSIYLVAQSEVDQSRGSKLILKHDSAVAGFLQLLVDITGQLKATKGLARLATPLVDNGHRNESGKLYIDVLENVFDAFCQYAPLPFQWAAVVERAMTVLHQSRPSRQAEVILIEEDATAASSSASSSALVPLSSERSESSVYDAFTRVQLQQLVRLGKDREHEMADRLRKAQRTAYYWRRKAEYFEQQLVAANTATTDTLVLRCEPHKKIPVQSAIALALRRNLTHSAAIDIGPALLCDVSKQRVLKAEFLCGASLVGYARQWHRDQEAMLNRGQRAPASQTMKLNRLTVILVLVVETCQHQCAVVQSVVCAYVRACVNARVKE